MSSYEKILKHFGAESQINKCCEELAELTTELMKHQNGSRNEEKIVSEIADCFIMLIQMVFLFHCRKKVTGYIRNKLSRTMRIVNADKWKGM
jgi:phosphoribosyl-ATP pyrophosphohydrolase